LILKIQDQKNMNSGQSAGISPYDGKSVTYVIPASHDFAEQNHHLAGIHHNDHPKALISVYPNLGAIRRKPC